MTMSLLLFHLQTDLKAANDSQLADKLDTDQATICRLRKNNKPLSPEFIMRCYDHAGYPVEKTIELFSRGDSSAKPNNSTKVKDHYDPTLIGRIPPDIIEAQLKISLWFKEQNIKEWVLGDIQSRN